jgi:hypothetical protein
MMVTGFPAGECKNLPRLLRRRVTLRLGVGSGRQAHLFKDMPCLFRICCLSLSICGGEFEASRPVASALHFVLQFVEQPAEFGRVLLGARKFDRPILRVAEVSVQESVQLDGRALKSGRAPCEAPPRHSVVFLFHRFWFFLILAGPMPWCTIRAFIHGTRQLNGGSDHQAGLDEARFLGHRTRRVQQAIESSANLLAMARVWRTRRLPSRAAVFFHSMRATRDWARFVNAF